MSSRAPAKRYVVKHYLRDVQTTQEDYDNGNHRGIKTVRRTQYGVYEPALKKDLTMYMKYRIISEEEARRARADGHHFTDEHAAAKKYPSGYDPADTREGQIRQKGVRFRGNPKAGISGKRAKLITESDLRYIAAEHSITPGTVQSIIQHADAVILDDLSHPSVKRSKKAKSSGAGRAFRSVPPRVEIDIVRPSDFIA